MKNGTKQKIDIAVLHERVERIDAAVDKILTNHLPHLEEKVDAIERKMAYYAGAVAVLVVVANYLLK